MSVFRGGVSYGFVDGQDLLLDVLRPAVSSLERAPLAIYVHGGGWHEGDRGAAMHPWLNPLLVAHGYVTASITYRLSGEARWPAQLHDVQAAVSWLHGHARELGADPGRLGIWGHSAGAHLAALAALTAPAGQTVQAVALSACPADLRGADLGSGDEVARLMGTDADSAALVAASPVCQVHADAPPFLVAHGTEDNVVSVQHGQALRDALTTAGADVAWLPVNGAGHDWADRPARRGSDEAAGTFGSAALGFFDRHLKRQ